MMWKRLWNELSLDERKRGGSSFPDSGRNRQCCSDSIPTLRACEGLAFREGELI